MKSKYYFWDFDGTLAKSPLPDTGKEQWFKQHGTQYPHIGWWSKPESLCLDTFDIKPNDEVLYVLLNTLIFNCTNWILTSRLPKLKEYVCNVLDNIHPNLSQDFDGMSFSSNLDKGQRILKIIEGQEVTSIDVYEDRDVEIIVLETIRETLENKGIVYNIHKIDNGEGSKL